MLFQEIDLVELLEENVSYIIIFIVILFGIIVALSLWVFKDAPKRGMNGIKWFFTVILLGFLGFIIYMNKRKKKLVNLVQAGVLMS